MNLFKVSAFAAKKIPPLLNPPSFFFLQGLTFFYVFKWFYPNFTQSLFNVDGRAISNSLNFRIRFYRKIINAISNPYVVDLKRITYFSSSE